MKNAAFIKKVLSLILALSLLFVFEACGNDGDVPSTAGTEPSSETETSGENEEAFAKPENYATVLTVTINPQFRLYLDADGIVLAVESVNKDAEEVKEELSFENDNYETVIEKIVTKSEEKGYVKKDAVINVEITETKDTTVNTVEILDKITVTVNQTATKLEVTVEIKTEDNSAVMDQPTEGATESTEQPSTEAPVPTQCNHTYKNATCTAPKTCSKCGATEGRVAGHNWSDATCTTPKTCKTCKATEGKATGHSYKDAACTTPKTCGKCGATEGSALGHKWTDATCTTPKTCSVCKVTDGSALGHSYSNATCTAAKKCSRCGATDGSALGHSYSNATCTAPKTCTKCGATEGRVAGHNWSDATCTTPKTCKTCKATEGKATGHGYKDATCTMPKTCAKCGITEGDAVGHTLTAQCTRCGNVNNGYATIHDGQWLIRTYRANGEINQLEITFKQDGSWDYLARWYRPIEMVAEQDGRTVEEIRQLATEGQYLPIHTIDGKEYVWEPFVIMAQLSYLEEGDVLNILFDWDGDVRIDGTTTLKRTGLSEYTVVSVDRGMFEAGMKLTFMG